MVLELELIARAFCCSNSGTLVLQDVSSNHHNPLENAEWFLRITGSISVLGFHDPTEHGAYVRVTVPFGSAA